MAGTGEETSAGAPRLDPTISTLSHYLITHLAGSGERDEKNAMENKLKALQYNDKALSHPEVTNGKKL